jgi:8-oxo-dGTP pyrophosphatase MutT (NUDIX family)
MFLMSDRWIAPAPMLAQIARRLAAALAPPAQDYVPLLVQDRVVGWITPQRAHRLAGWPKVFHVSAARVECAAELATPASRTAAFAAVARTLAEENALTTWRDERYGVYGRPDEAPLFEIERAAARYFGVHTFAAHANGVVAEKKGWLMWLARRSPTKPIDPGLLDNLVGGGVAAGTTPAETLVKEAWEEAGIDAGAARAAHLAGDVHICRDQPDGLQHETTYVHDLWLPSDFVPVNQDGEAVQHRLCAPDDVLAVLTTDDITADASLVIVDFLIRHGNLPAHDPSLATLEGLRHRSTSLALPG